MRAALLAPLAGLGLLAAPVAAFAQDPPAAGETAASGAGPADNDAAREAFAAGEQAYDAGEFAHAAAQFETVYRLTGSAEVAFNVALSYDSDGQAERAAEWYHAYLDGAPDAPDRADVEARVAELEAATAPASAEPEGFVLAPHRLRASFGWAFYPGGAVYQGTPVSPVDIDGFRLELGYQYALYKGLILDTSVGGTWGAKVQASQRTWDVWSAAVGLGWVWTSLDYVEIGVRGGIAMYAMVPNVGSTHFLVPFRAGAWLEFPIFDWFALHFGGDLELGAYVGRDDKVFGFGGEVGVGATFSLGGGSAVPSPNPAPAPRPSTPATLHAPGDDLGRGWQ